MASTDLSLNMYDLCTSHVLTTTNKSMTSTSSLNIKCNRVGLHILGDGYVWVAVDSNFHIVWVLQATMSDSEACGSKTNSQFLPEREDVNQFVQVNIKIN